MYNAEEVVYILCPLLSVAEESILNEEKTSDEMKTRIMQGAHSRIDYLLATTLQHSFTQLKTMFLLRVIHPV